nr:ABC transporter B family member 11 [Ipomoea batatas]
MSPTLKVSHNLSTSAHAVITPKASAKVLLPFKTIEAYSDDGDNSGKKSSSGSLGNILGLANYESDDDNEIQSTLKQVDANNLIGNGSSLKKIEKVGDFSDNAKSGVLEENIVEEVPVEIEGKNLSVDKKKRKMENSHIQESQNKSDQKDKVNDKSVMSGEKENESDSRKRASIDTKEDMVSKFKANRTSTGKPVCIHEDTWRIWEAYWDRPDVKAKSKQQRKNRMSEVAGLGTGCSRHTRGSRSAIEHYHKLRDELQKEPNLFECFEHMHKKKNGAFVDERKKYKHDMMLQRKRWKGQLSHQL